MSAKLTEQKALVLLEENLKKYAEISLKDASPKDLYKALAMISQEMLLGKREKFNSKCTKSGAKKVHYLCMEFLLGRNLKSTLLFALRIKLLLQLASRSSRVPKEAWKLFKITD